MKNLIYLLMSLCLSSHTRAAEVVVFAASSLTDALSAIAQSYEKETKTKIQISFDASSRLAKQISEGAKANMFISADKQWITFLEEKKHVIPGNSIPLLSNELTLITHKDSKITVKDLKSLGKSKFKTLSLAQETVPAGKYAYETLAKLGILANVKSRIVQGDNVRNVLAWVSKNEADLAIVFSTDAKADPNVKELLKIPAELHSKILYPVAMVGPYANKDTLFFYMYLQGIQARKIFESFGFKISNL